MVTWPSKVGGIRSLETNFVNYFSAERFEWVLKLPVPLEASFVEPVEKVDLGTSSPDVRVHPDELEQCSGAALLDSNDQGFRQFAPGFEALLLQEPVLWQVAAGRLDDRVIISVWNLDIVGSHWTKGEVLLRVLSVLDAYSLKVCAETETGKIRQKIRFKNFYVY